MEQRKNGEVTTTDRHPGYFRADITIPQQIAQNKAAIAWTESQIAKAVNGQGRLKAEKLVKYLTVLKKVRDSIQSDPRTQDQATSELQAAA